MDPISIASGTLGAAFLQEGIKFLWSEAGRILERFHKRAGSEREHAIELTDPAPAALQFPPTRHADVARVREHAAELERLTKELTLYGIGARSIAATDAEMVSTAEQLRSLLAKIYNLPSALPSIRSLVVVATVHEGGDVVGLRAHDGLSTPVESVVRANQVYGAITGIDLSKR
jgi:hypothetical protein